jgi:hypothetical protein
MRLRMLFIPRNRIVSQLDYIVIAGRKRYGSPSDRLEIIDDDILIISGRLASRTGIAHPKACIALQFLAYW